MQLTKYLKSERNTRLALLSAYSVTSIAMVFVFFKLFALGDTLTTILTIPFALTFLYVWGLIGYYLITE